MVSEYPGKADLVVPAYRADTDQDYFLTESPEGGRE
jgi:hypothetical protein